MTVIMCDVDSTLVDFEAIVVNIARDHGFDWPTNCNWWVDPAECGKTIEDFYDVFRVCHSREFFMDQMPYPLASESLQRLAMNIPDLKIFYVSHRHEEDNHVMSEWLRKWFFPFSNNTISTFNKIAWIAENKPEIVIDDRVRTMIAAKDLGATVYSLVQSWNCNLKNNEISGIHLRDNWNELGRLIHDRLRLAEGVTVES